jgi:HB1, ASXL, restriction endonuclease HTH domain
MWCDGVRMARAQDTEAIKECTMSKGSKKSVKQSGSSHVPSAAAAKRKPHPSKPEHAAEKGLSCLDAAAKVLREAKEPMSCKQLIDTIFAAKLWHSDAPTPAATLSSAILREMSTKKTASRFKKVGRGQFAHA